MASCDYCNTMILFGGVRDGDWRFCNDKCHQAWTLVSIADHVPEEVLAQIVKDVHQGDCPKCAGPGPVDVHTSYTIWSALVLTTWGSRPQVCCQSCGNRAKLGGALSSSVLGWWGIPWGLFGTPVQIIRNLGGLFSAPDPLVPSAQLEKMVRMQIAAGMFGQEPTPEPRS